MDNLVFENYDGFVGFVSDEYEKVKKRDSYSSVSVIAKYDDAKEVIKSLIKIGYGINCIEIESLDIGGYEDEYIISISQNEIWCEPARRDAGYIYTEENICFVLDNCNSALVPRIRADVIYEVGIGYDDLDDECDYECDGNCSECTYMSDKDDDNDINVHLLDGDTHGFTVSKSDGDSSVSYSYYTSDKLSQSDIQSMLKAFGF